MSETGPHDEFLELCAVSTSGELTEEEQRTLEEHLAVCQSCREALRQYEAVAEEAMPALGAKLEPDGERGSDSSWSVDDAERAFFQRLMREREEPIRRKGEADPWRYPPGQRPLPAGPSWGSVWMLYAAGVLLIASLGLYAYRLRQQTLQNNDAEQSAIEASGQKQASLEEQLSDTGHEREIAHTEIERRDRTIADLRQELARQSGQISQLKAAQKQLENDLSGSHVGQQEQTARQAELAQKLDLAQSHSRDLQQKVDSLTQQSVQDVARAKSLEARNNDLTRLLQDRETELERQEQLLAHDRDIRDLMGARDLYMAEVYDVARTGETEKPYGRVFYTRGKSLIFYAYDLDQQREAKKASTFQAWGWRGPDRQQAVSLGIFYEDNVSKKRWILKCDNPATLAQIDGVFVTVEPNGGSHKPSGKSLLFAYLKVDPNHP